MATAAPAARSWNPDFVHSDRERWICIYPAYLNSRKKLSEGRQVAALKAVDNPLPAEIRDVVAAAGLTLGIENKVYPREPDRNCRGRIRVHLKNDDGTPVLPQFPTRKALLEYICETIPKLKGRQSSMAQQQSSSAAASSGGGSKKGKSKKK
jgi:signal recognition particle subunit SRP19